MHLLFEDGPHLAIFAPAVELAWAMQCKPGLARANLHDLLTGLGAGSVVSAGGTVWPSSWALMSAMLAVVMVLELEWWAGWISLHSKRRFAWWFSASWGSSRGKRWRYSTPSPVHLSNPASPLPFSHQLLVFLHHQLCYSPSSFITL